MEIQFYGANCIKLSSKKSSVVFDDNLEQLGKKSITTDKDIALITNPHVNTPAKAHFVIDGPGEYEVSEVAIHGVSARAHMDEEKAQTATMYRVVIDDTRIAVVGHIHPDLSELQLEELGIIDILFVPIGGHGYTLDGIGAHKIISKIDPKIVIPTHYADKGLNYEVPQADLEESLKSIGIEASETVDSLKLKNLEFAETTKLIVLNQK